jgi:hypothetical protein
MAVELPDCLKCAHYHITYDPAKPYGCRAMGFKSRRMPAQVVYAASGLVCQLFTLKSRPGDSGKGEKRG